MAKTFLITQKRSLIGCSESQRRTMTALGLRGRHKSVLVADNVANRGQIVKIQHLVDVDVQAAGAAPTAATKKTAGAAPKKAAAATTAKKAQRSL